MIAEADQHDRLVGRASTSELGCHRQQHLMGESAFADQGDKSGLLQVDKHPVPGARVAHGDEGR